MKDEKKQESHPPVGVHGGAPCWPKVNPVYPKGKTTQKTCLYSLSGKQPSNQRKSGVTNNFERFFI
jgi:hypothetical protein